MSLRAVVGVRAARRSNNFFSHRNQKHLSNMMKSYRYRKEEFLKEILYLTRIPLNEGTQSVTLIT